MDNKLLIDNNIPKSYFRLAIPNVLSMLVGMIYNLADTYFVAGTGITDLVAGVSLCAPIITIQMAFGNIYAQGGCTLTSRLLGSGKRDEIRRVSSHSIYMGYILGLALGAFLLILRQPLVTALGADADTVTYASPYYFWLALGTPFIVGSYAYTNLFRSEGMSRQAMIGSSVGVILNIILDPILIYRAGMGAKGAAIATVIGYIVANIYCIVILLGKSSILSLNPAGFRVPPDFERQMLGIGIPAAIMNLVQSFSVIFMNHFLLPYGNEAIAAMGIALKSVSIVFFVMIGLAYGGQPLFGYFFGASDGERLRRLCGFNFRLMILTGAALSAVVFAAAPALIRVFMDIPEIVSAGGLMLRLQAATMTLAGLVLLITLIFQSAGKIGISFVLSVCRQGYAFLAVLFVSSRLFGYYGVISAQTVADVISILIAGILFYRRIWRTLRPVAK